MTQSIIVAMGFATTFLFAITAALIWAITGGVASALGVGLFCAFWGGPAFGVIAGGAAHSLASDRHDRLTAEATTQGLEAAFSADAIDDAQSAAVSNRRTEAHAGV